MPLYILLIGMIVLLDQLMKYFIQANIPLNVSYEVIPGALSIGHVRNYGAAWSMMLGQRWFFIVIGLLALVVLSYYLKKLYQNWLYALGFAFLISGTLGNLLDRLLTGYVVDMFELDFINFPVFNIADCALTLGVIVVLIAMMRDKEGLFV